jgi:ADP-dependent NAD(P)H-hydrate dehydratase
VTAPAEVRLLTPTLLRAWPLPTPDGAKDSRGTVLVIGGSRTTPGAALLAGTAALRAGAGKLQVATAESVAPSLAVAVPEAMVVGLPETADGAVSGESAERLGDLVGGADVVLLGPGLTDVAHTGELLDAVLAAAGDHTALVLDAYALLALAERDARDVVRGLGTTPVLTPNVSEGAALLGRDPSDDLDQEAATLARDLGCVVWMFGHVASPEGEAWRQEAAGVGLGTSGSGDVLAGVVAGMVARGAPPAQAACWAIHVHAAAGDLQAVERGRTSYLAREIVDAVAPALAALEV